MRRTVVDLHGEGSEEYRRPLLGTILETIGSPISLGQLTHLITATIEEVMRHCRSMPVTEVEVEASTKKVPVVEATIHSSIGAICSCFSTKYYMQRK